MLLHLEVFLEVEVGVPSVQHHTQAEKQTLSRT